LPDNSKTIDTLKVDANASLNARQITFHNIKNPQAGMSAGLKDCDFRYRLQMVSVDEYVSFVIHSFSRQHCMHREFN
jgi:hypothetical protein